MTLLVMVVTGSGGLSVNKKQNEKVNMGPIRQKLGGDCDWVMQEQQRIKRKIRWNLELRTPFKNIFESGSHVHLCPELQQFSDRQL